MKALILATAAALISAPAIAGQVASGPLGGGDTVRTTCPIRGRSQPDPRHRPPSPARGGHPKPMPDCPAEPASGQPSPSS